MAMVLGAVLVLFGCARGAPEVFVAAPCPVCPEGGSANVLVLGNQRQAGMSDRETIIGSTAHLAAQLCAKLVAPLPCHSLNGRHGVSLSCRMEWVDFFSLVDGSGEQVLVEGGSHGAVVGRGAAYAQLRSSTGAEAAAALEAALAYARNGTRFVWRLETLFYVWRDELSDRARELRVAWTGRPDWRRGTLPLVAPPGLCAMGMSPRIGALVRRAATLAGAAFDALHVRRTDAQRECSTHVDDDVRAYLECADGLRRAKLMLLFTDESSSAYKERVLGLDALRRDGRSAGDGDAVVAAALVNRTDARDANSAATISLVGKQLMGLAASRFEMSRSTCRSRVGKG